MSEAVTVEVEPVTRVEGHGKTVVEFDEEGNLRDARFHVTEMRGFEKFLEGRFIEDAPILTPRICGICQVAHHLASAKAADEVFGVEPPEPGRKLRELMHHAATVHSHALHFYFLAAPDLVDPGREPEERHVLALAREEPDLVKRAIELRKIGQTIVEAVGGKAIHPVTAVPGGVSRPLEEERREELLELARRAVELADETVETARELTRRLEEGLLELGSVETYHMGMVRDGVHELYDGVIRVVDPEGRVDREFEPSEYLEHIAEAVRPYSYLKFPYLRDYGEEDGVYRVNTLSRLNVCDEMATPRAQERYEELVEEYGSPCHHPMLYHYARAIELLSSAERCVELLEDDEITGDDVREEVDPDDVTGEGVGCVEAPHGTLIHHFRTDEEGRITEANLIVATVQNNPAMDLGVRRVAEEYLEGPEDATPEVLNYMEMVIRAYDPCLSCATHALGGRPRLTLEVRRAGEVVRVVRG